jgi:hypothetical protein
MATSRPRYNENKAWQALPSSQKSFVTSLLHFFHYRRQRIAASWRQEETLTWELYLALRVLHRQHFLDPLLHHLAEAGSGVRTAVALLRRTPDRVSIEYSPSLRLGGNKRNSCSDISLTANSGAAVWLEAKTAKLAPQLLMAQLKIQQSAVASLALSAPAHVVALLPSTQEQPDWPSITWAAILDITESCQRHLQTLDPGLFDGLAFLAGELAGRIRGHPLGIAA